MLSVRTDQPIAISVHFLEDQQMQRAATLRELLASLETFVKGSAGGTTFAYSLVVESRIVRIKAARGSWRNPWTADLLVVSPDTWVGDGDEVRLEGTFLYGPALDVPQQEVDAQSACRRIDERLSDAVKALLRTEEFKKRLKP